MRSRRAAGTMAVLVALAAIVGGGCRSHRAATPFVIGFIGHFEGEDGVYDRAGLAGAQYEVARRNARDGIDGQRIELRVEPVGLDPTESAAAATRLVEAGARVLIVPSLLEPAHEAIERARSLDVPALSLGSTIPASIAGADGFGFLTAFGDNVQGAAAAEYALGAGLRTAVTISSPDIAQYTDHLPEYFAARFRDGGGIVVRDIGIALDDEGIRAAADGVASLPAPPDVVYTAIYPPALSHLLVALRTAGYTGPVVTADGSETPRLFDAGPSVGEVVLTAHAYSSSDRLSGLLFAPRSASEKIAVFVDGYERFHGAPPESVSFAALGADAIDVVHAAAERAGTSAPADLAEAIGALRRVDVTTGRITYDGETGVPVKVVYLLRAVDGRFQLIRPIEPSRVPRVIASPSPS